MFYFFVDFWYFLSYIGNMVSIKYEDVSQADVEKVEEAVGMRSGAWDCIDPKEIIASSRSLTPNRDARKIYISRYTPCGFEDAGLIISVKPTEGEAISDCLSYWKTNQENICGESCWVETWKIGSYRPLSIKQIRKSR